MIRILSEESYHIICLRGTAQECLFSSYQSLTSLEKIHSAKKKTLIDFGNVTCICIFSKGKSAKCMEIKQKK